MAGRDLGANPSSSFPLHPIIGSWGIAAGRACRRRSQPGSLFHLSIPSCRPTRSPDLQRQTSPAVYWETFVQTNSISASRSAQSPRNCLPVSFHPPSLLLQPPARLSSPPDSPCPFHLGARMQIPSSSSPRLSSTPTCSRTLQVRCEVLFVKHSSSISSVFVNQPSQAKSRIVIVNLHLILLYVRSVGQFHRPQ